MGDMTCDKTHCTFTLASNEPAPASKPAPKRPAPEAAPPDDPAVVVERAPRRTFEFPPEVVVGTVPKAVVFEEDEVGPVVSGAVTFTDEEAGAVPPGGPGVVTFEEGSVLVAPRPRRYRPAPSEAEVRDDRQVLRIGDEGPVVRRLQRGLRAAGYAIEEDGKFGPRTRDAVMQLQRARGQEGEQGRVGSSTLRAATEALHDAHGHATEGLDPEVARQVRELNETTRLREFELTTAELVQSADFRALSPRLQSNVLHRIGREPSTEARRERAERLLHMADAGLLSADTRMWDQVDRLRVFQTPGMPG
jgi:hypothetical protein